MAVIGAAVFLDKDGTLVEDVPYNVDPARLCLTAGAARGLSALAAAGFRLAVVSNQPGVALGYFDEHALGAVQRRLHDLFAACGAHLDGFFYCPHHPQGRVVQYAGPCACRKPQPGLLHSAAAVMGIDLHRSWMVGDILDDVEAGRAAGTRTVLLDNGHETEWRLTTQRVPDRVATDLCQAARLIVAAPHPRTRRDGHFPMRRPRQTPVDA